MATSSDGGFLSYLLSGDPTSGFMADLDVVGANVGGIAGALGAGGPQAMTAFANKIADSQQMELSRRWQGFQKGQDQQFQMLRDEASRAHDESMLELKHKLETQTERDKQREVVSAAIHSGGPALIRSVAAGSGGTLLPDASPGAAIDLVMSGLNPGGVLNVAQAHAADTSASAIILDRFAVADDARGSNPTEQGVYAQILITAEETFGQRADAVVTNINRLIEGLDRPDLSPEARTNFARELKVQLDASRETFGEYVRAEINPQIFEARSNVDRLTALEEKFDDAKRIAGMAELSGTSTEAVASLPEALVAGKLPEWFGLVSDLDDPSFNAVLKGAEPTLANLQNVATLLTRLPVEQRAALNGGSVDPALEAALAHWDELTAAEGRPLTAESLMIKRKLMQQGDDADGVAKIDKMLEAFSNKSDKDLANEVVQFKSADNFRAEFESDVLGLLPAFLRGHYATAEALLGPELIETALDTGPGGFAASTEQPLATSFRGYELRPHGGPGGGFSSSAVVRVPQYAPDKLRINPTVQKKILEALLKPLFDMPDDMPAEEWRRQTIETANAAISLMHLQGTGAVHDKFIADLMGGLGQLNMQHGLAISKAGILPSDAVAAIGEVVEGFSGLPEVEQLRELNGSSKSETRGDDLATYYSANAPLPADLAGSSTYRRQFWWLQEHGSTADDAATGLAAGAEDRTYGIGDILAIVTEANPKLAADIQAAVSREAHAQTMPGGAGSMKETITLAGPSRLRDNYKLYSRPLQMARYYAPSGRDQHRPEAGEGRGKISRENAVRLDFILNADPSTVTDPEMRARFTLIQTALRSQDVTSIRQRLIENDSGFNLAELLPEGLVPEASPDPTITDPSGERVDLPGGVWSIPFKRQELRGVVDDLTRTITTLGGEGKRRLIGTIAADIDFTDPDEIQTPGYVTPAVIDAFLLEANRRLEAAKTSLLALEHRPAIDNGLDYFRQVLVGSTPDAVGLDDSIEDLAGRAKDLLPMIGLAQGIMPDAPNQAKVLFDTMQQQNSYEEAVSVFVTFMHNNADNFTKGRYPTGAGHPAELGDRLTAEFRRNLSALYDDVNQLSMSGQLPFINSGDVPEGSRQYLATGFDAPEEVEATPGKKSGALYEKQSYQRAIFLIMSSLAERQQLVIAGEH